MKNLKIIATFAVYAAAMALAEAAVVVYLRELYYPAGFFIQAAADLQVIPWKIFRVEIWREAATIVMLAAFAWHQRRIFSNHVAVDRAGMVSASALRYPWCYFFSATCKIAFLTIH